LKLKQHNTLIKVLCLKKFGRARCISARPNFF
jgi:hypothetical protein